MTITANEINVLTRFNLEMPENKISKIFANFRKCSHPIGKRARTGFVDGILFVRMATFVRKRLLSKRDFFYVFDEWSVFGDKLVKKMVTRW